MQCHNEVRGDLAALYIAYKDVIHQLIVCEGSDTVPALIADLGIRGVWLPQIDAFLTIELQMLIDALSYLSHSVKNVLNTYTPEEVSM